MLLVTFLDLFHCAGAAVLSKLSPAVSVFTLCVSYNDRLRFNVKSTPRHVSRAHVARRNNLRAAGLSGICMGSALREGSNVCLMFSMWQQIRDMMPHI